MLAMAAVWVLSNVAVHYPHELMAPARVEHFATCLYTEGVSLAGTDFRAPEDSRHCEKFSASYYNHTGKGGLDGLLIAQSAVSEMARGKVDWEAA